MALTPKQRKFVREYIKTSNASEAYRRSYDASGCTPRSINTRAWELLQIGEIADMIKELEEKADNEAIMTRAEALRKLTVLARTDLADLVEFSTVPVGEKDGEEVNQAVWNIKDSVLQDPERLAAISELTAGRDGIKIKTHSVVTAIQQLAKMQGWEAPSKVDHLNSDGSLAAQPTRIEIVAPSMSKGNDDPAS